jgi:diguanylate cyclase (GGDEF)-like protein
LFKPKRKSGKKLSITRWVAGFFSVVGIAMLGIAGVGLFNLYKLDKEVAQARTSAARNELSMAMLALQKNVGRQSEILAHWDETRQQLTNPGYYGDWKSSRLQRAGVLADFFQELNLYDQHAAPLPGGSATKLTGQPRNSAGVTLFHPDRGLRHITHVAPVYSDPDRQVLLGYMQVEFDLVKALKQSRSFSYLEPDTLGTDYAGPPLPLEQLTRQISFEVSPAREFSLLKESVIRTTALFALLILAVAMIAYMAIQRRLARPLVDLASAIGSLRADESRPQHVETLATPFPLRELDTVRQAVQEYRQKLGDARTELENRNVSFQKQALQDALTGVFNRRAFDMDWEKLTGKLEGRVMPMAFLLFDCDHFKPINDTYGHHTGDKVLQTIAASVSQVLRAEDVLYRIGGDEFVTLLSHTDEEMALHIAQRCLESVRKQDFSQYGILEPVSISIGIAIGTVKSADDLTRIQAHADAAMYQAKRPGSEKIALYREGDITTDDALVATLETNALFQALANPEKMEMHFQRMEPLDGGQVYLEALCRIRHQEVLLTPDRFLPVVQSRRLESDFDLVVIRQIQAILEAGQIPPNTGISINLSAQSLGRPEIITQLIELTKLIEAHPLILEITETSLVPRLMEITYFLKILRSNGYKIALDDFGSGYSPLRYLSDLPVDIVKFDMSLVHQLQNGGRAGLVVIDFARLMIDAGYTLVAEGIENEDQLEKVRTLGFGFAQGFHIHRPTPIARLTANAEALVLA